MAGWILESDEPALLLRLPAGVIKTIGRDARADFVVEAPLVSRVHCRLTATEEGLTVEDLDSTNGVLVNGQREGRSSLRTGDVLTVGRVRFRVTTGNDG